jgi:putative hydrolase of the HAD superfamily
MAEHAEKGNVRAVLFDLGDTLLNYGRLSPYKPFFQAARQSYDYLKDIGQPVACFPCYAVRSMLMIRWRILWSAITKKDFDSLRLLKRAGKKAGYNMTPEQYMELVWLWYEPLSRCVRTEPNLRETLARLQQRGLKMGIVSNTFVNACALNRDLAQRNLGDFFEFVYYSYEFARRKPRQEMYRAAIETLGLAPREIIFVGDRLDTDVKGAIEAGMIPVLKITEKNMNKKTPPGVLRISSLAELPDLVEAY